VDLTIPGERVHDIFFLGYKPDGQLFHSESWGVVDAYDTHPLLAIGGNDEIFMTAFFSDSAKIRDTILTVPEPKSASPTQDAFIAKVGKILPAGVHKHTESSNIIVYPNPATGTTNISLALENTTPVTISLYSLLGEKMMTVYDGVGKIGVSNFTANVSELTAGVYHLRIETSSGVVIRQIIVQ
jgi:hypothetical protein